MYLVNMALKGCEPVLSAMFHEIVISLSPVASRDTFSDGPGTVTGTIEVQPFEMPFADKQNDRSVPTKQVLSKVPVQLLCPVCVLNVQFLLGWMKLSTRFGHPSPVTVT